MLVKIPLEQFDISAYAPETVGADIPEILLSKLLNSPGVMAEKPIDGSEDGETELKLRAIIDTLVHAGLRQRAGSKRNSPISVSYFLPRLSEIIVQEDGDLNIVLLQNQLIVMAPAIEGKVTVPSLIGRINALLNSSHGASTWILDLSLVDRIPLELFAYLIGLRHALSRIQVELDLLWLKRDAVPQELVESIQANFNLFAKGIFLLSR